MRAVAKNTTFQRPPDLSDTALWYCVVARPGQLVQASLQLYALGYRTFYPKHRKWRTHARTKVAVEVPIDGLSRYLFCEVDHPHQSFGMACLANGVERFLSRRQGDEMVPAVIPARWIEDLRLRQMAGEWDAIASNPIPIGARIRILEGEFGGKLATVTKRRGHRLDFSVMGEVRTGRLHECSVAAA